MLVMVIMAVIGVMVYRIAVATALYQLTKGSAFYSKAKLMVSLSAATLNLIIIVILNKVGGLFNYGGCFEQTISLNHIQHCFLALPIRSLVVDQS